MNPRVIYNHKFFQLFFGVKNCINRMNSSFCKVYVINNKISVATINCSRSSIVQQPSFCHKSRNPFSLDEGITQWYMSELDITWCCFIHFTAVFYITIYELRYANSPITMHDLRRIDN